MCESDIIPSFRDAPAGREPNRRSRKTTRKRLRGACRRLVTRLPPMRPSSDNLHRQAFASCRRPWRQRIAERSVSHDGSDPPERLLITTRARRRQLCRTAHALSWLACVTMGRCGSLPLACGWRVPELRLLVHDDASFFRSPHLALFIPSCSQHAHLLPCDTGQLGALGISPHPAPRLSR